MKFRNVVMMMVLLVFALAVFVPSSSAQAQAANTTLSITPITWDVVGLDSNNVNAGPNHYPVGARVCNTGSVAATNVESTFVWDSTDTYINLRSGSLTEYTVGNGNAVVSLGPSDCYDFYYEVEITRNSAAYNHTREYHITAVADNADAVSTPTPRELYVEYLVSQNRNSTSNMQLDGADIPVGGSMSLMVGQTYSIKLIAATATNGYEQLESFIHLPNTIFQILAVSTTYTADTSAYVSSPNDKLYADACLWEDNPDAPNARSCLDVGKNGGDLTITYTVKIIGGAGSGDSLNSMIYDFSGSSYHYNSDYGISGRFFEIVDPTAATITKRFVSDTILTGGTSTIYFTLTNPTGATLTDVNFDDTFPTSPGNMVVAGTPNISYRGCGSGVFNPVPTGGEGSVAFENGTIAPGSSCTIKIDVTAPTGGEYDNTTGNLYIGTVDTGSNGNDKLTASASASTCVSGQTMAVWTVSSTATNPPDVAGGVPTTKASDVSTATIAAAIPGSAGVVSGGSNDSNSWEIYGFKTAGNYALITLDTSKYSEISMTFWIDTSSAGPSSLLVDYDGGGGSYTNILTVSPPATTFTQHTIDFTGKTNTSGNTLIKIYGTGANNDNSGAGFFLDHITLTGCRVASTPPTLSKAFGTDPIKVGANSLLTFTIANTKTSNVALTNVTFTDDLPTGLEVASTPGIVTTGAGCTGVTFAPSAGDTSITYTASNMTAGATCTAAVYVTGTAEGAYENITSYISSTESGENKDSDGFGTDTITVIAPPEIEKSFGDTTILTGDTTTLTFTITNPNQATTLNGIAFEDTMPAGVALADDSTTECGGGTLTTTAATSKVQLSGGSLAAGASCTFSVTVTGATVGAKYNVTGVVTSTEGGDGNTDNATFYVKDPSPKLNILKQIGFTNSATDVWNEFVSVDPLPDDVYFKFVVENVGDVDLTNVSVSDSTLTGLSVDLSSCEWANIPTSNPIQECVVGPLSVSVAGSLTNTASAAGKYGTTDVVSGNDTAKYGTPGLTLEKSVTETYFEAAGDVLHYSYKVTNSGNVPLEGPVTGTDDKTTVTCPDVTTVGDNNTYLDPAEYITCTATYTVLVGDVTAGVVTNKATASVDGVASNEDQASVYIEADLSLEVTISDTTPTVGDTVTFTIKVSNAGPSAATTVEVTDIVPAGYTYVASSIAGGDSQNDSSPAGTGLTWTINSIAKGVDVLLTFDAVVGDTGPYKNAAEITGSDVHDPDSTADNDDGDQSEDDESSVTPTVGTPPEPPAPEPKNPSSVSGLPGTGFAPGIETVLPPAVGEASQYISYGNGIVLEIPALGVEKTIWGIPLVDGSWDLSWLWDNIGYLEGTAFPTLEGNTVLSAHAYLSNGDPGPFAHLNQLGWGDTILIHTDGLTYTYEVHQVSYVSPWNLSPLNHKDGDWVTLLSCYQYSEAFGGYRWRVVVQAVLISISD